MKAPSSFTSACRKEVAFPSPRVRSDRAGRKQQPPCTSWEHQGGAGGGGGRPLSVCRMTSCLPSPARPPSPHPWDAEPPVSVACLLLSPQGWGGAGQGRARAGAPLPAAPGKHNNRQIYRRGRLLLQRLIRAALLHPLSLPPGFQKTLQESAG